MKTIQEWLAEYNESHLNPTNKMIHWICVPAILFTIIGILMHLSALLTALLLVLSLIFYARLDLVLAIAMAAVLGAMSTLTLILPVGKPFYFALFLQS